MPSPTMMTTATTTITPPVCAVSTQIFTVTTATTTRISPIFIGMTAIQATGA